MNLETHAAYLKKNGYVRPLVGTVNFFAISPHILTDPSEHCQTPRSAVLELPYFGFWSALRVEWGHAYLHLTACAFGSSGMQPTFPK